MIMQILKGLFLHLVTEATMKATSQTMWSIERRANLTKSTINHKKVKDKADAHAPKLLAMLFEAPLRIRSRLPLVEALIVF